MSPVSNFNGVTAHRGNSSEFPENTISAFESALSLEVDWIECDIHRTKDGQIVIIHDADTGRVGDVSIEVSCATLKELKSVDVAYQFRALNKMTLSRCAAASIPLFIDVIRLIMRQNKTRISIQPKADCVEQAIMIIKDLEAEEWVGFNDDSLHKMKEVKRRDKSIPVFWDRPADADIDTDLQVAKQAGFEAIVIEDNGITEAAIAEIHQAGLQVGAWTVNNACRMKSLIAIGIDRIYTDCPRLLLQLRGEA